MPLIIKAPVSGIQIYIIIIVDASLIVLSSIRRPKNLALFFLRNTEIALLNNTAIVVVFIPPAVEPGDPPISISIMIRERPMLLMAVRLAVLNPAVLGVTA